MHINRAILDSILPNLTFEDVFQFVDHSQHILSNVNKVW